MVDFPERSASEYAREIANARDRLLTFVESCTDEQWAACVFDEGDLRPAGIIADHVADAYDYLQGFISQIVGGKRPEITGAIIDQLNAKHAAAAGGVRRSESAERLRRLGDRLSALVGSLSPEDFERQKSRIGRLAEIAIRHADAHRHEIEVALG